MNDIRDGLLRGVDNLLRRCLRHGLLRTEVQVMLVDIEQALVPSTTEEIFKRVCAGPQPMSGRALMDKVMPGPTIGEALLQRIRRAIPSHGTHSEDAINAFEELQRVLSAVSATAPGRPAFPTHREIIEATQLYRAEIDKRMDTRHPSSSPSIESMTVVLRDLWVKLAARTLDVPPVVVSSTPRKLCMRPCDGSKTKPDCDWPDCLKAYAPTGEEVEAFPKRLEEQVHFMTRQAQMLAEEGNDVSADVMNKACGFLHALWHEVEQERRFKYKANLRADAAEAAVSATVPKTGAVYLVDGKPHRMCDCDPMKGDCPRGNERQLQTTQFSRCLVPAEGVVIL